MSTNDGQSTKINQIKSTSEKQLLDTFESTDSAYRNSLIGNVKQIFERGPIRTLAAAETLINLIQENKIKSAR